MFLFRSRRGLTIVELLTVIAILVVLIGGVLIPLLQQLKGDAGASVNQAVSTQVAEESSVVKQYYLTESSSTLLLVVDGSDDTRAKELIARTIEEIKKTRTVEHITPYGPRRVILKLKPDSKSE